MEEWSIIEPEKTLLKTSRLGKDPEDYENNCLQKRIGLELGLRRGDDINYYLADNDLFVFIKLIAVEELYSWIGSFEC